MSGCVSAGGQPTAPQGRRRQRLPAAGEKFLAFCRVLFENPLWKSSRKSGGCQHPSAKKSRKSGVLPNFRCKKSRSVRTFCKKIRKKKVAKSGLVAKKVDKKSCSVGTCCLKKNVWAPECRYLLLKKILAPECRDLFLLEACQLPCRAAGGSHFPPQTKHFWRFVDYFNGIYNNKAHVTWRNGAT